MSGSVDAFWELAPLLRVRPEVQQRCQLGAQWAFPHAPEPRNWAAFHIVTHGGCLLDVADQVGLRLEAGDVAVLPHGGRHTTRALKVAKGASRPMKTERRCEGQLLVKSNVEGDPDTMLICGRLLFEHVHENLVLAALPPVVILRSGAENDAIRIRRIVDNMQAELEEERLGAVAIAASMATGLLMTVLRAHLERHRDPKGIAGLLATRQTAKAVSAMLCDLARPWTLDELSVQANTSRATLVRLFQKVAGTAPLAFLSELRLNLARHRLLATDAPVAVIAGDVGYQSEAAFSRAYHRRFGAAPGADRRKGPDPIAAKRD